MFQYFTYHNKMIYIYKEIIFIIPNYILVKFMSRLYLYKQFCLFKSFNYYTY